MEHCDKGTLQQLMLSEQVVPFAGEIIEKGWCRLSDLVCVRSERPPEKVSPKEFRTVSERFR